MKSRRSRLRFLVILPMTLLLAGASQCSRSGDPAPSSEDERLITILQTNDIHGSVESYSDKSGAKYGGMAMLGGIVRAIREGLEARHGDHAGVLVVDAGDQFQGSLISNFNEGQLVFSLMNDIGYDAVVPGNHDYDFGPVGWLEDQVTSDTEDQDPRGALLKLKALAKFPLISANTYYKNSIRDSEGRTIPVKGVRCEPLSPASIDWKQATRPEFLTPHTVKTVAGVRVALIGLDNPTTPDTTTPANVSDLCFREKAETYLEIRRALEGKADVFVAVLHDGDTRTESHASDFVRELHQVAFTGSIIDAVVAGHTHQVNDVDVAGVPVIQSGSGNRMFGRIDLVWDMKARKINRSKSQGFGGLQTWFHQCADQAKTFCETAGKAPKFDGTQAQPDPEISDQISLARKEVEKVSGRKLGVAEGKLYVDRINESPLANVLTDAFRDLTGSDVAFMNTGGLRAPIAAGVVTYDMLYTVLPFNNHGVEIAPMSVGKLFKLLERSMRSCGLYGSLMQSGLRVVFEKDCSRIPAGAGIDVNARLLRVETVSGEVLLDVAKGIQPPAGRSFRVATLDFLSAGGSGYVDFKGVPLVRDIGIVREAMTSRFLELGGNSRFSAKVDGRWREVPPQH